MINNTSFDEFIDSPDTIDFVIRQNKFITRYMEENPGIIFTQTLSGSYVLCYSKINDFLNINQELGINKIDSESLVLGLLDRQNLEAAGIAQVQQLPQIDLKGRGVLVGFVDTGIDYTQNVFRYDDGTSKIQFIYDQTTRGNTPEGFFIGTEYTNAQINEALKAADPYDIVPQKDTAGHGTFLASVAAGRGVGDYIGAAPDAELVVVKLKKARPYYLSLYSVPDNQENAFESSDVMLGVEYILKKARQLDRPVVICIGIGTNFGSHDGFSIFEEYLTDISVQSGVCVCCAAGNESQTAHHMLGAIPKTGDSQNIDIRVGNNAGDVMISIWNTVSDKFSISVRSPLGDSIPRVSSTPRKAFESDLIISRTKIQIEIYFPVQGSSGQETVVKLIRAIPGIWTITVYGDIIFDGSYHVWLPMTGFISPGVELITVSPYYTITVPATMLGSICCGAYDSVNNNIYYDSSWGPTRAPVLAPDLVAPGVNVGGFYPAGYGTMTGTSAAAAITAGACALILQWGIIEEHNVVLSTHEIRGYLIRGCNHITGTSYPNTQSGYGYLNLMQTFQLMTGI